MGIFNMGICRDSIHKKHLQGGKKGSGRKKRKYELGRQPSNTKIGPKKISMVRVRGGNFKKRALFLETGNFSYLSLNITRKTKIIAVVYNSTNNELVRTNTLVKGSIIQIEPAPFRDILQKVSFNDKNDGIRTPNQITTGKLLARICSRPGQTGRVDGYILEGIELEFYLKKIQKKKTIKN